MNFFCLLFYSVKNGRNTFKEERDKSVLTKAPCFSYDTGKADICQL